MRFCDFCAQPEHSHHEPCAGARWVESAEMQSEPGSLKCPVLGCQYRQDVSDTSSEKAKQVFAHHLAWHMDNPKPPRAAAVPEGGTDWDAWAATLTPLLARLAPGQAEVLRAGIVKVMRTLEDAQW